MATTISGPTVTDDTGTPASPNEDGTLIDSAFFTSFYNAINAMWSGATHVFDGILTISGFGTHTFSSGGTGVNRITVVNPTAGTGNFGSVEVGSDVSDRLGRFDAFSSSWSGGTATQNASAVALRAMGSGGLYISAEDASGFIKFAAGGTATNHTIDSDGIFNFAKGINLINIQSPAQIVANTNNYNPAGLPSVNVLRINSDAARDLTGIAAQDNGRFVLLCNVGSFSITLKHDVTSTAANRFYCPGSADVVLSANDSTIIWYDGTDSRWRVIDLPNAT